jgi:hypothetical protein
VVVTETKNLFIVISPKRNQGCHGYMGRAFKFASIRDGRAHAWPACGARPAGQSDRDTNWVSRCHSFHVGLKTLSRQFTKVCASKGLRRKQVAPLEIAFCGCGAADVTDCEVAIVWGGAVRTSDKNRQ